MIRATHLYNYLLCSLELEGGNNGKSASDDIIILRCTRQISVQEIKDLLRMYCRDKGITVESSEECPNWLYFRLRLTGNVIGGVCVTQGKEVLTICFGDTKTISENEEVLKIEA